MLETRRHQLEVAEKLIAAVCELPAADASDFHLHGEVLEKLGRFGEAVEQYTNASGRDPAAFPPAYRHAMSLGQSIFEGTEPHYYPGTAKHMVEQVSTAVDALSALTSRAIKKEFRLADGDREAVEDIVASAALTLSARARIAGVRFSLLGDDASASNEGQLRVLVRKSYPDRSSVEELRSLSEERSTDVSSSRLAAALTGTIEVRSGRVPDRDRVLAGFAEHLPYGHDQQPPSIVATELGGITDDSHWLTQYNLAVTLAELVRERSSREASDRYANRVDFNEVAAVRRTSRWRQEARRLLESAILASSGRLPRATIEADDSLEEIVDASADE